MRSWLNVAVLGCVAWAHAAIAQDAATELTPAGKTILQHALRPTPSSPSIALDRRGFPLAICAFPRGLCGAVRADGSVAVPPRYDWVGTFSDHRAAVRSGGLYGFVDENGREIVKPQYRIVDHFRFGFAQVDVDGKSGLIDQDGKMVFEPKYGSIVAIGPDRFRVSDHRALGGMTGGENFSGRTTRFTSSGGVVVSSPVEIGDPTSGVIDRSGEWIERPGAQQSIAFDKDDPSIGWKQSSNRWGLARADGSWIVEPEFELAGPLMDGMARVKLNGKFGFIDRTGKFAIEPVFDKAGDFVPGLGRAWAERNSIVGAIDKAGQWIFQAGFQHLLVANSFDGDRKPFGWHFKAADRWGLLDLDGRGLLEAEFDQPVQRCADGRLVAYKDKEWLYFKSDGTPLQPANGRFIDASCGSDPPYTLKTGDKFGLVDVQWRALTPAQFDAAVPAGPGLKNVKLDGKWGRIGPDGRWLLEPRYDYLSTGSENFVASLDGKRGFMRSDGSWLVEPKFDAAGRLHHWDDAFVTVSGATGVLRLSDQSWVIPPRPGVLCAVPHAIMWQNAGKRVILSPAGETWIDVDAERVGTNIEIGLLTFLKNGKWGLVDTAGQVVVDPEFDEPVYFTPGLRGIAWAKRDSKWCAIDRHGRAIPGIACADTDPMQLPISRFECKVER